MLRMIDDYRFDRFFDPRDAELHERGVELRKLSQRRGGAAPGSIRAALNAGKAADAKRRAAGKVPPVSLPQLNLPPLES